MNKKKEIKVVFDNDHVEFFRNKQDLDIFLGEWTPSDEAYYGGICKILET